MKLPDNLSKFRLHPFFIDILLSGVTQAAILAANLIMVSLISKWMGLAELGEYLLLKRVSTWLVTSAQLGLGIALAREIACIVNNTELRANQCFATAFTLTIPLLAVISGVAVFVPRSLAQLLFNSQEADLIYGLVLLLSGSVLQALVFGYYRGLQKMRHANMVQLGVLVLIPLLTLVAVRSYRSAPLLIEATGVCMVALSVAWSVPILFKSRDFTTHFVPDTRLLLGYGVVRVPGDIACGALLTLGPMLVSHYASMEQLSYMLLGITCLSMTGLAFWPVVMLLLAKVSKLLGEERLDDVKVYVQHLRSAVLQLSVLATTQALVFIGPLVRWWLGPSSLPGVPVICIIMLAIPGFMYYYAMRSVLDAASTTPYNTRNVLVALGIFSLVSLTIIHFAPRDWVLLGVSASMTIALYALAIATDRSLRALKVVDQAPQMSSMWIVALLAVVSLAAQAVFHFEITKIAFCAVQLMNLALALLLMRESRPEWVTFVGRIALSRA
jgi:O-antigen/teichoic acid export membrane protein